MIFIRRTVYDSVVTVAKGPCIKDVRGQEEGGGSSLSGKADTERKGMCLWILDVNFSFSIFF